ncbi:MAG TPA: L,D-transpeptidase, partial [Actinomycetota bacterium]
DSRNTMRKEQGSMPQFGVTSIVSRSRLLARALIVFVAVVVVGGLTVDAYVWHRNSSRPRTVATSHPLAAPVATPTTTASAPPPVPVPASSLVADVAVPAISVYGAPAVGKVLASVPNVNAMGQKEALLVTDASVPGWYEVQVPVRPSGSQGWVQAASVTIREVPDYIRVYQSQFRLEYYVGGQLKKSFTVAVGAPSTPTPFGHFYVWASEVYGGEYSPGIFALSAFSPVLENWPGGGRTGIHGWTDTSVMGKRASHGCVRMAPAEFAQLLHTVPLGTPVDLLA